MFYGNHKAWYPSSNSFSYSTGWGYEPRLYGEIGPKATTTAKITVAGMEGMSHTLVLDTFFAGYN